MTMTGIALVVDMLGHEITTLRQQLAQTTEALAERERINALLREQLAEARSASNG